VRKDERVASQCYDALQQNKVQSARGGAGRIDERVASQCYDALQQNKVQSARGRAGRKDERVASQCYDALQQNKVQSARGGGSDEGKRWKKYGGSETTSHINEGASERCASSFGCGVANLKAWP